MATGEFWLGCCSLLPEESKSEDTGIVKKFLFHYNSAI